MASSGTTLRMFKISLQYILDRLSQIVVPKSAMPDSRCPAGPDVKIQSTAGDQWNNLTMQATQHTGVRLTINQLPIRSQSLMFSTFNRFINSFIRGIM